MENKKQGKTWLLSLVHLLIGGFIIPFVISNILFLLVSMFIGSLQYTMSFDSYELVKKIIRDIILMFSLLIGVYYSARFIKWKYLITDANSLINLSTILYIVFEIFWTSIGFFSSSVPIISMTFFINISASIIEVIIYYFSSKKFLVNTTLIS